MTKDVIVAIQGLQMQVEGDVEPVELITAASYYKKNGKHYILYDELTEDFGESTKNVIKIYEDCVDITKRGAANVHMIFEKDKKNVTYYNTPFGNLLIGIEAKRIELLEREESIEVHVDYTLEVNYEHLSDCSIQVRVTAKDAGEFHI